MNERDPRSVKVTKRVTFREPIACIMGESPVSTELSMSDETGPCKDPNKRQKSSNDPEASLGPKEESKIEQMRVISNEEKEEEERYGVSTELTLFTDPWTIKKALTPNDLDYLNSLSLNASTVESHIMRFLHENDQRKVHGSGLVVNVYDHDTHSMHKLLLKKWSTDQTYALYNGWRMGFVRRRSLKDGDEIGMYWDRSDSNLHFRVLSRAPTFQ
ncbi:unnamed protein product [Microthlaspi erraticum]|uniref:TF-B3 domain-containing protein n=1 Tax=Microthlaspi erraticum TaxID=1685480 RepID=A0A6D2J479_9BRAS|nr:unnamed protein product [Microthlaspi erraticum]